MTLLAYLYNFLQTTLIAAHFTQENRPIICAIDCTNRNYIVKQLCSH
jgi:hypothetical protein